MANTEEIIKQSQANVKALKERLSELDELHANLKEQAKQPKLFAERYEKIVELTVDYTNTLGKSTKKYLDGANSLFTLKLEELGDEIAQIHTQSERLENIDLEKHFNKHASTLAEIFTAINSVNSSLANITLSLSAVAQSLSELGALETSNHKAVLENSAKSEEKIHEKLAVQDRQAESLKALLEETEAGLQEKIATLTKSGKLNRILMISFFLAVQATLVFILVKVL
jgi:chromosome segregation ATPase